MMFEDRHITATFWAGVIDLTLRWIFGWEVLGMFGISLISYSIIHQLLKSKDKIKIKNPKSVRRK